MSIDVADWLRRLGLEQYAPSFAANDIDGDVLSELTVDDLIGLGVTSIGHRRKILATRLFVQRRPAAPPPSLTLPRLQVRGGWGRTPSGAS
jgi:SAM domain (Sterile alpha motif)